MQYYLLKVRIIEDWYYCNWAFMEKVDKISNNNSFMTKDKFLLSKDDAQELMIHLIKDKENINEVSIIKTTNFKPYSEYEVIEYRHIK